MFLKTKNSNDTDSDQTDAKEDLNGEKKSKKLFSYWYSFEIWLKCKIQS